MLSCLLVAALGSGSLRGSSRRLLTESVPTVTLVDVAQLVGRMTGSSRTSSPSRELLGSPADDERPHIPHIIHQCDRALPLVPAAAAAVANLTAMNPDWEWRFYNDSRMRELIARRMPPEVIEAYERIDPAYGPAKADLFRYVIMYLEGGVYLDIKSVSTKPLTDIVGQSKVPIVSHWTSAANTWAYSVASKLPLLAHWSTGRFPSGEYQNWHLVYPPHHPIMKDTIDAVVAEIDTEFRKPDGAPRKRGKDGVIRTTGPHVYSRVINQHLHEDPRAATVYDSDIELGLAYDFACVENGGYCGAEQGHAHTDMHAGAGAGSGAGAADGDGDGDGDEDGDGDGSDLHYSHYYRPVVPFSKAPHYEAGRRRQLQLQEQHEALQRRQ